MGVIMTALRTAGREIKLSITTALAMKANTFSHLVSYLWTWVL
jgi:hypothetical protein